MFTVQLVTITDAIIGAVIVVIVATAAEMI
jgi:hypothetical protein